MPKPKVLFVEDESSISGPFSKALAREGFEPVVAATAKRALELAEEIEPDIVLMDLTLPDGDGRDVTPRDPAPLQRPDPDAHRPRDRDGPDRRPGDRRRRLRRQAVQRRRGDRPHPRRPAPHRCGAQEEHAAPEPVTVGDLHVDPGARRVQLAGEELQLSRKEFDLLAELVSHAGRVVTREDLMSRVWDENWFGSTKTLDVHIRWLRQKLGDAPDSPRYVHTVRGVGFRFTAPEEWE